MYISLLERGLRGLIFMRVGATLGSYCCRSLCLIGYVVLDS